MSARTIKPGEPIQLHGTPSKTWYLSFADGARPTGEQFLGAIICIAPSFEVAVQWTHWVKLNPGGEVQGLEVLHDEEALKPWMGRLLSRADLDELDRVLLVRH
jgi:hypothetical protein